jgi:signal transduction histidine kinase
MVSTMGGCREDQLVRSIVSVRLATSRTPRSRRSARNARTFDVGNAIRHGEPTAIEVRLAATASGAELTVRDNGHGFDPQRVGERHGMGLGLMHERLSEVGGAVTVISAPGHGTTVSVTLPIRTADATT